MYKLQFENRVKKDLKKLDKIELLKIKKALGEFIANYDIDYEKTLIKSGKIKKLKGDFQGFYRLRLRTFRMIFEKQEDRLIILVLRIVHRKEVYKYEII